MQVSDSMSCQSPRQLFVAEKWRDADKLVEPGEGTVDTVKRRVSDAFASCPKQRHRRKGYKRWNVKRTAIIVLV